MKKWSILGVDILTENGLNENSSIYFNDKKIEKISKKLINDMPSFEIEGLLLPGMINSHDHLVGTYFPKVGNGPYKNYLPWHNDLRNSDVYEERRKLDDKDLYLLGAYRNIISGVTTVSDHIPHDMSGPFYDDLPIKVIREFTMEHSIAKSFALEWGKGPYLEYKKALKKDIPFLTHISEGFDNETIEDVINLEKEGGLGDHSVLIHGVAFSESDIDLIKKRNASVVWCANSNIFMFEKTTNIKLLLEKGINTCIGTDSAFSGGINLLHEMKFDKMYYKKQYNKELNDKIIYKMVTENPAKAFRQKKIGKIKEGYLADIIIIENKCDSPESSLINAEFKDIKLVMINGKPIYGNSEFSKLFDYHGVNYYDITIEGNSKIITGDITGLLQKISHRVGFKKTFPFLPVDFDY